MLLSMRRSHQVLIAMFIAAACVAAPVAYASGGKGLSAGDYAGNGSKVKATVAVDGSGDARVRYSLKGSCGAVNGSLSLRSTPGGALRGKRVSAGKSTVVRVSPRGGTELSGSIRYVATSGNGDRAKTCKAHRTFTAVLDADSPAAIQSMTGHYEGKGNDGGRPISFDVAYDRSQGSLEVRNMSFETDTECWDDLNGDGEDDALVAKISGLSAEVDSYGGFEIDYEPADDTEFYVEGTLEDGEADLYVEVGGYFAADGTPLDGGPFECDSWGENYAASRVR